MSPCGVSTIGAVARNGPPDDFHNQQTQHANYGVGGPPPTVPPTPETPPDRREPPEYFDPLDQETEPTPWYRRPAGLIAWVVVVGILIALIVYGIIELIHGGQGTTQTPTTSTTSTTPTTATTTTVPTTTTTQPTTTSPTGSAVEPPAQQPTRQPTHQPTQQQPTHHHHLPPLPSVITIPEVPTVITLPPGLR